MSATSVPEPIAIVGSGCRFPGGATSPSKLWDLLANPRDTLVPIPTDRFSTQGFYHENGQYHGHTNVKDAYLLEGKGVQRKFDAQFFGVNSSEASTMDPQLRLLLETVYEALEAAGHTIEGLQGSDTAMYTGLMLEDYERVMIRDEEYMGTYHITGTARSLVSNRVSYFFDWHGPSMTIDTACSSSMVAVHQAVQQLRSGQSKVAIAAGTNLFLDPQLFLSASKLRMLSPDGRSRMWDADANGYARGEGVAAVVLKPLSVAEADGDAIECIIRETGTNQDGKTPGLTMPSARAQERLMKECYARAGLDPTDPRQRPQYFEAHGTGTPAGDPIEAEAISSVFFPSSAVTADDTQPLFVGSIKTVIGHTEGTAGLAGLLKASLALQHGLIPPNLLFNRLNPRIEPFYTNLQVPTSAIAWPSTSLHRRASVNSFGFGGSNAHAILESYPSRTENFPLSSTPTVYLPFVFSAVSEGSLVAYLREFCQYLRDHHESLRLEQIAHTLYSRRSRFPISTVFAASDPDGLCAQIEEKLQLTANGGKECGVRATTTSRTGRKPRLLGVFTGQGAQWARQGVELFESSSAARDIIERLQTRLDQLPLSDLPTWSLLDELEKDDASSRIAEAEFSQPLCTAIQIVQIELLRKAGVELSAVVGHSSGEIAAAFAAGYISAEDAICIAYYRGICTRFAQGANGKEGSMMAVETSLERMQELCDSDQFKGRLCVAASNAPSSQTVSGDRDAVMELKAIFDTEGSFARPLKVTKAYHSHHMHACATPYLNSLADLNIQILPGNSCQWFSSVPNCDPTSDSQILSGTYWNDNMTHSVFFTQAINSAWAAHGPFEGAIEIGPHPALRNPATQSIQRISGSSIPYFGVSKRGSNAVETLVSSLGAVESRFGPASVDFEELNEFLSSGDRTIEVVKGLPSYSWNHEMDYWHESRYAQAMRTRSDPVHSLLGHLTPDSTDQEMRWRHLIRPKELPWLNGHQLQSQTVFPAAGYVVLALEAAMAMAHDKPVSLLEVLDLDIGRALTFDNDESCFEALFSLSDITDTAGLYIDATFKYHAALAQSSTNKSSLDVFARGTVRVSLGPSTPGRLPSRRLPCSDALPVSPDDFYKSLSDLDYHYSHPFDALTGMKRTLGTSTGSIKAVEASDYLVHPAVLDAAFQTVFLAYAAPYDGSLWTMHVPRTIKAVRVNPDICSSECASNATFPFDTVLPEGTSNVGGDIDIFSNRGEHAMIQVEGLTCVPFSEATSEDDKEIFSKTVWNVLTPNAEIVTNDQLATAADWNKAHLLERTAIFYLRQLQEVVPADHPSRSTGPYVRLFKFASHMLSLAASGDLTFWQSAWSADTHAELLEVQGVLAEDIDFKLLNTMGQNLADIAMGSKSGIELGMEDDLLAQVYEQGLGWPDCTNYLARTVKQIVHRYPHMDILEVGAGTGGATKAIYREVGSSFASYTFTDISSGFFEAARDALHDLADRTTFKVLDLSKDPVDQGFKAGSYDLVVASMVLHATTPLETTMRNVRRLLKPGGYLVALEGQALEVARLGTVFGCFPDWWTGAGEGRELSPFIDLVGWDELLLTTGFSGCDTATPHIESLIKPFTVFVSQAVDDRVNCLREPLSSPLATIETTATTRDVILVGGQRLPISRLATQLKSLLGRHYASIRVFKSLRDISHAPVSPSTTLISLTELDQPLFENVTSAEWEGLQKCLLTCQRVFWVTSGRRASKPHANMVLGLLRTLVREQPTLNVQLLDLEDSSRIEGRVLAEAVLRFELVLDWQSADEPIDMLLSLEPEIVVDLSGQAMIPRLIMDKAMNDRYNSSRREIKTSAQLKSDELAIENTDSGYALSHRRLEHNQERLLVSKSLLRPLRVSMTGCLFAVLGRNSTTSQTVVGLSDTNGSSVTAWHGICSPVDITEISEGHVLTSISHFILASVVLKDLAENDTLIAYEPDEEFAAVLRAEAELIGVDVTLVSSNRKSTPQGWLHVHPSAPERYIASSIPKKASAFVDFSSTKSGSPIVDRIRAQLSVYCRVETRDTLFGTNAYTPNDSHVYDIQLRLENASRKAISWLSKKENALFGQSVLAAGDLTSAKDDLPLMTIIDWAVDSDVPVKVQPIENKIFFSADKTYWLAGLSGGLGLSLCEWMIRHGAKHVALTSRRPDIRSEWLEKMESLGGNVTIMSCDITDRDAVSQVYHRINSTLPPIGGVAQGAMVLQDVSFSDMGLDAFEKVVKPKVNGSIYLNDLLQGVELDFFVFFSSLSAVIGNVGQANYASANLFMSSLAEQRRQSGLAASVINIGPVLGTGYIAKENINIRSVVQLGGYNFISETDFHQLFAEAVVLGKPGSTDSIEITTGLTTVSAQADNLPPWASNPFMSHFVRNKELSNSNGTTISANVPVKAQLAKADTQEEVTEIIRAAFIQKIASLYQLDAEKLHGEDLDSLQLDGLGTDSLLAVEIRTWFMKTLQVNVPVLKILNGASIGELIETATESLAPAPGLLDDLTPAPTPMEQPSAPRPEPIRIPTVDECKVATRAVKTEELDSKGTRSGSASEGHPSLPASGASDAGDTEVSSPPATAASKGNWTISSPAVPFTPMTPITPRKTRKLSFSQEMFWFVSMFEEDKTSMNHTALFRLTGQISYPDFRQAVFSVIQRHESLRTCFAEQNGQAMQGVIDFPAVNLEHHDIAEEEEATDRFNDLKHHSYDLERGDTLRMHLLALSPTVHFLVVGAHGMVADGQSLQVLLRDLAQHYAKGSPASKPQQYLDYSEKQRLELASGGFDDDLKFWRSELADAPPPLPTFRLAKAVARPMLATLENERVDIRVDATTKAQIQNVCRQCRVTPFHFYLATFRAFLMRHAVTEDFAIGIGDANRDDGLMDSIGSFVNLLPLNFHTRAEDVFQDILKDTRKKAYSALSHSKIPFQVLLNQLDLPRSATHTPVFQAFVDYRQGQRQKQRWADDCQLELLEFQASKLAYDIALDIIDDPDGECVVMLIVRNDLYTHEQAERLAKSYELLVKQFCENSDQSLSNPGLYERDEIDQALALSKGPEPASEWPKTILHRFEEISGTFPDLSAVSCDGLSATYGELLDRVKTIAGNLEFAGITNGKRVAVLQEPSIDWVASVLAIMFVGASYLPLDLSQPFARLCTIAQDCGPDLMLIDSSTEGLVPNLKLPDLRYLNVTAITCGSVFGEIAASESGVATYLYTSGSTGKPKGVPLTHGGLRNWFESTAKLFGVGQERVMQQSSSAFDMSLLQLFTALCSGGCVCLVPRRLRGDARGISNFILSERITWTYACSSECSSWMSYGSSEALSSSSWKTAFVGGEPITDALLEKFASLHKSGLQLNNFYGPTEATFAATAMPLVYDTSLETNSYGNIAVGYPLPHYKVYVVDDQMRAVPLGVQGEILIGGPGVVPGYLENEEMTQEKFVPDTVTPSSSILHRTGDLGRWREDGALQIEGRVSGDTQIKLRGLRIDLREVEHAIRAYGGRDVSEAVVSVRRLHPQGHDMLTAHVVFANSCQHHVQTQLVQKLSSDLDIPQYMLPSLVIPIEALPTTNSGKIDRRATAELPLPETRENEKEEYSLTETESRLKELWAAVIDGSVTSAHNIGPDTDFFHVGGTSLLLLGLQAQIRQAFSVEFPLPEMFDMSTLSAMARRIEGQEQQQSASTIRWDDETRLPSQLLDVKSLAAINPCEKQVVVLTGATGYLGSGLLESLIHDPNISEVHCVAVRNGTKREELQKFDKVFAYEGNLSQPRLGLSVEKAERIFGHATRIIHNGADVSYMKTYESLRRPNLESTKQLVEMCLPRMVPFHFVSTAGTCSFAAAAGENEIAPVSVQQYPPPTNGTAGYASSKWASEVFLEKLNEVHPDWPVWIHRPSNIERKGETDMDLVQNLQQYSRLLGAVPSMQSSLHGQMDSVTLEAVVSEVLTAVVSDHSPGVHYHHEIGGVRFTVRDLGSKSGLHDTHSDGVQEFAGREIPVDEWATRAGEAGMHQTLVEFLKTFGEHGSIVFPKLVK